METLFPPGFEALLRSILERTPKVRGGSDARARAERRVRAASGTFLGHRAYEPGEDLRLVDWNAYARSGELYTKVLEDDAPRALTLVIDRSASMEVGAPSRRVAALRFAAILGALALARLDALHLVLAADDVRTLHGLGDRADLLASLAATTRADIAPLELARAVVERERAGTVCWITDLAEPGAFAVALRALVAQRRSCLCLVPRLDLDVAPREDGGVEFFDPEHGVRERFVVDAALRAAMVEELARHARRQEAVARAAGAQLLRVPVPSEGDFRIAAWWPGALRAWI